MTMTYSQPVDKTGWNREWQEAQRRLVLVPCGYVGSGVSSIKHRRRVTSERSYIQGLQRAVTVGSGRDYRFGAMSSRVAQGTATSRTKCEEVGRCQPMGKRMGVRGSALLIKCCSPSHPSAGRRSRRGRQPNHHTVVLHVNLVVWSLGQKRNNDQGVSSRSYLSLACRSLWRTSTFEASA